MLYVFVEGIDDKRFCSCFFDKNEIADYIEYASDKKEKTNNFIKSIKSIPCMDYLLFADADGRTIEQTKQYIKSLYRDVDIEKIIVVQYEIESWYYAGLNKTNHDKMKIKRYVYDTNDLTKEMFNAKLPKPSERIYYMQQILNCFCVQEARLRNHSINRFFDVIEKQTGEFNKAVC